MRDITGEDQMCYKVIWIEINPKSKQTKELFLHKRCKKIDEEMTQGNVEAAYSSIKSFFGKQIIRFYGMKNDDGRFVYEQERNTLRSCLEEAR